MTAPLYASSWISFPDQPCQPSRLAEAAENLMSYHSPKASKQQEVGKSLTWMMRAPQAQRKSGLLSRVSAEWTHYWSFPGLPAYWAGVRNWWNLKSMKCHLHQRFSCYPSIDHIYLKMNSIHCASKFNHKTGIVPCSTNLCSTGRDHYMICSTKFEDQQKKTTLLSINTFRPNIISHSFTTCSALHQLQDQEDSCNIAGFLTTFER